MDKMRELERGYIFTDFLFHVVVKNCMEWRYPTAILFVEPCRYEGHRPISEPWNLYELLFHGATWAIYCVRISFIFACRQHFSPVPGEKKKNLSIYFYCKKSLLTPNSLLYTNANSPGLTSIGPLLWQAKQTVSSLCQLQPATYVSHSKLALAKLG